MNAPITQRAHMLAKLASELLDAVEVGNNIDALEVLADAAQLVQDMTGTVVATARAQDHSWTDIGSGLGITKQAAQQRFGTTKRPAAPKGSVPLPLG